MNRTWCRGIAAAGLAFGLLGAGSLAGGPGAAAADYPETNLKMAHFLPATYSGAEWEQWWADELRKRSGGAVDVEIFWGGSLGGPMEILELVGSGAVPLGVTAQGYFLSDLPVAGTAGNLMMRTHSGPSEALDTWRKFQQDPQVQRELADAGVVELTAQAANPYELTCTRPVRTVAEIEGLRIRVPGAYMPDWWASLGAVPVSIPLVEQYEALQKGTVDCAYIPHDQIFAAKLDEVAKYAIDLSTGSHVTWNIFMNADAYAALPQSVKDLMQEVSEEMMTKLAAHNEALAIRTVQETMPARGVELVAFQEKDLVDARALDTVTLWVQRLTDAGLADAAGRLEPVLRAQQDAFHE